MYAILYRKKTNTWMTVCLPDRVLIDGAEFTESSIYKYLKKEYPKFEIYSIAF